MSFFSGIPVGGWVRVRFIDIERGRNKSFHIQFEVSFARNVPLNTRMLVQSDHDKLE